MQTQIEKLLGEKISDLTVMGGGVNQTYTANYNTQKIFIKTGADNLNLEARELQLLNQFVKTPEVIASNQNLLILEYIHPHFNANYAGVLANSLCKLHTSTNDLFGFECDNKIGIIKQHNPWSDNWAAFYWQHRLVWQINLAFKNRLITQQNYNAMHELKNINDSLLNINITPTLLHGDLWRGNIISTKNEVYFIDSSCYYGHSEMDLALGFMFGGFDEKFYKIYFKNHPQQSGFKQRKWLYMLYHYLNHLNIFGTSYYNSVLNCLKNLT